MRARVGRRGEKKCGVPLARLQVALSVKGGGEGHVVQSARDSVGPLVRQHAGDTVLRLIRWQLTTQDVRGDVGLETGVGGGSMVEEIKIDGQNEKSQRGRGLFGGGEG